MLVVVGPSRVEYLVAYALAVDEGFVVAQAGDIEHRPDRFGLDLEILPHQRGRVVGGLGHLRDVPDCHAHAVVQGPVKFLHGLLCGFPLLPFFTPQAVWLCRNPACRSPVLCRDCSHRPLCGPAPCRSLAFFVPDADFPVASAERLKSFSGIFNGYSRALPAAAVPEVRLVGREQFRCAGNHHLPGGLHGIP